MVDYNPLTPMGLLHMLSPTVTSQMQIFIVELNERLSFVLVRKKMARYLDRSETCR